MGKLTLDAANECIYCGSKDELRLEHVIAYSFHGDIEMPQASCKKCGDVTGRLEGFIARNLLSVGRAALGLRSRRKDLPTTVPITITYGKYGPQETVQVPVDRAPMAVVLPLFRRTESSSEDIESIIVTRAALIPSNNEARIRGDALKRKYRAHGIEFESGSLNLTIRVVPRVLWKSFSGLLWHIDRKSFDASRMAEFVLGGDESRFILRGEEEGSIYRVLNLFIR